VNLPYIPTSLLAVVFGSQFVAQVSGLDLGWIGPVINGGGFAVMVWMLRWFMEESREARKSSNERMEKIERVIRESNDIQLLHMAERSAVEAVKAEAERRLAEARQATKAAPS
jgi:hypothetical protein